jgi:hypothetical protein
LGDPRRPDGSRESTSEAGRASSVASSLRELQAFPLVEALLGRRSRRFGLGMSIPSGPLAYTSRQPPQPLSEVERLLLVALGAGVTGWNLGIPHSRGPEGRGCDYALRPAGRSYPSGAATYGSELLITDDSGSYITRLRDFVPTAIRQHREATGQSSSVEQALEQVRSHLVRLSDTRVELPREYPHIGTHNQWVANQPGSTLFVPVADQAETLLNLLWIYTGEGSPIVDVSQGRLLGSPERLLAAGRLHRERAVSLAEVESVAVKHTTHTISSSGSRHWDWAGGCTRGSTPAACWARGPRMVCLVSGSAVPSGRGPRSPFR